MSCGPLMIDNVVYAARYNRIIVSSLGWDGSGEGPRLDFDVFDVQWRGTGTGTDTGTGIRPTQTEHTLFP